VCDLGGALFPFATTLHACSLLQGQGAKVGVRVQESNVNESDERVLKGSPPAAKIQNMARALATTDRTAKCESLLTIVLVVVCFHISGVTVNMIQLFAVAPRWTLRYIQVNTPQVYCATLSGSVGCD
jgi:hypothetical protein